MSGGRSQPCPEEELTCHDMQALGLLIHHQVVKLSSGVTLSLGKLFSLSLRTLNLQKSGRNTNTLSTLSSRVCSVDLCPAAKAAVCHGCGWLEAGNWANIHLYWAESGAAAVAGEAGCLEGSLCLVDWSTGPVTQNVGH